MKNTTIKISSVWDSFKKFYLKIFELKTA